MPHRYQRVESTVPVAFVMYGATHRVVCSMKPSPFSLITKIPDILFGSGVMNSFT